MVHEIGRRGYAGLALKVFVADPARLITIMTRFLARTR
jgi:hypothetical protein